MIRRYFKSRGSFVVYAISLVVLMFFIDLGLKAHAQAQRRHEIKEEETFKRPEPSRPIQPEVPGVNRYQEDKVFLEYADSLYKVKNPRDTVERQILKGNVKFRQAGLWMYCDSAYYYPEENSLDAFSNVKMEQGDTLFVYADQLFYNGDEHLAKLRNGETREKVTLINKDVTLTTDSLDYDMSVDIGWYSKWGTIDDKVNTLTSLYGEYSPKTKRAEFYTDVVLVNQKDGFTMLTDTLYYSTETHIANIESKTEIQSANDTIFTNKAIYYTDTGDADLLSRSLIIHKDSTGNVTTLEGDSIIYDNTTRISRAYMYRDPFKKSTPMVINDTAQKTILIGGFGMYNDSTREALATEYPLLMEYSQSDTLFLRADTIKTFIITEMIPDSRRKSKSGFPEFNEMPIVRADSAGLWIDTNFFAVRIPYLDTPLIRLMKAAPKQEEAELDKIEEEQSEETAEALNVIENRPDSLVSPLDSLSISTIKEMYDLHNEEDTTSSNKPALGVDSLAMPDSVLLISKDSLKLEPPVQLEVPDSLKTDLLTDSIGDTAVKVDSIAREYHVVKAYYRARFFKQDMQGVADSMVFIEKDSILYLFRKPIIWSGERQVTGNRIDVHFNDSTTDWAYLPEFGLMSEWVDEDFYNQIFGKEITAFFENNGLRRMKISGNVETIFLPQEEDSTFNRLVHAESSYMDAYLNENKLDWLKMWPEVSGTVTPIFLVKRNQMYLPNFKWWNFLRPEREWYGDRIKWADNLGEVPDELEQYFLSPSDFGEPKSFSGTRNMSPVQAMPVLQGVTNQLQVPDSINSEYENPAIEEAEKTETISDIEQSEASEIEESEEIESQTEEIEKSLNEAKENPKKEEEEGNE